MRHEHERFHPGVHQLVGLLKLQVVVTLGGFDQHLGSQFFCALLKGVQIRLPALNLQGIQQKSHLEWSPWIGIIYGLSTGDWGDQKQRHQHEAEQSREETEHAVTSIGTEVTVASAHWGRNPITYFRFHSPLTGLPPLSPQTPKVVA